MAAPMLDECPPQRQGAAEEPRFAPGIVETGNDRLQPGGLALRLTLPQADELFGRLRVQLTMILTQIAVRLLRGGGLARRII